jgi:hypothetical protein
VKGLDSKREVGKKMGSNRKEHLTMAQVTLRDLSTNEDFTVPPEGYIFGRVGGDADIQIEDNAISRRQARVSQKGGMWLLETLAVPQGARPPRPVQLQEGATFNVGQSEFEVVTIEGQEEVDPQARTFAPTKGKPAPSAAAPAAKRAPPAPNAKTAAVAPAPRRGASAPISTPAPAKDEPSEHTVEGKGIAAIFVSAPQGLAYYLVNVPKMVVNPLGTVRTTIDEQPAEPMGRTELIGYALPALLGSGMLGAISGGLAAIIRPPHHFELMSFLPIPAIIVGFIGAIIIGFVWHPVLTWVIDKLHGESDARSRTNFFLQSMTLLLILAVPGALGALLSAVPIPFINVLGPLLGVVASLATIYTTIQWFEFFKVFKWVKTVLMVLGALAVVGALWGVKATVQSAVGSAAVATAQGVDDTRPDTPPSDPEEALEWAKTKQAQMLAKAAEEQKNAEAEVEAKADEPVKTAKKDPAKAERENAKVENEAAKPEAKAEKEAEREPEAIAAKDVPPVAVKEEPVASPSGAYGAFARRRDAIEKLLENDPTVLQKNADLQRLYGEYSEGAYDLDKKWAKESAKKPERSKLHARLRDAELFSKTSKTVDSMAQKLGIR